MKGTVHFSLATRIYLATGFFLNILNLLTHLWSATDTRCNLACQSLTSVTNILIFFSLFAKKNWQWIKGFGATWHVNYGRDSKSNRSLFNWFSMTPCTHQSQKRKNGNIILGYSPRTESFILRENSIPLLYKQKFYQ